MSCARDWREGFATKRPAANCVVACPWASCGEKATAKFVSLPMKLWSAPSTRSLRIQGAGIGSQGLALVPLRGPSLSDAEAHERLDPLGRADIHCDPSPTHRSGVCWRLPLRKVSS